MIDVDVNKVSEIILECVENVIMPHYQNLRSGEIEEKAPNDYVTVADKESEKFLTAKLTALLPDSIVLGEESVAADKSVLNRIKEHKPVWIIDPIDGTRHFIEGDRRWGVLLALSFENETQYGWIYDAIEKRMITVAKGKGVFVEDKKVDNIFKSSDNLADLKIGCHGPLFYNDNLSKDLKQFKSVSENFCSVEHLSDFILGKSVDILAGLGKVNSWDNAAGFLAIEELGGCLLLSDGSSYKPSFAERDLWVASANKEICQRILNIIKPKI